MTLLKNPILLDCFIFFYFLLFFYSGIQAFQQEKLQKKIERFQRKTNNFLSENTVKNLILASSTLMILCCLLIWIYIIFKSEFIKPFLQYIFSFFIIFLVVVTYVYYINLPIAFLTNLSLLCGVLVIMTTYD